MKSFTALLQMPNDLSFIRLVNIKVLSKIVHFQMNTMLFPQLLSSNINTKVLKVCPISLAITTRWKQYLILNIKEKKEVGEK